MKANVKCSPKLKKKSKLFILLLRFQSFLVNFLKMFLECSFLIHFFTRFFAHNLFLLIFYLQIKIKMHIKFLLYFQSFIFYKNCEFSQLILSLVYQTISVHRPKIIDRFNRLFRSNRSKRSIKSIYYFWSIDRTQY